MEDLDKRLALNLGSFRVGKRNRNNQPKQALFLRFGKKNDLIF
jgi:hypothetical protein